jgi:membrane protein
MDAAPFRRLEAVVQTATRLDLEAWTRVIRGARERARRERLGLVAAGVGFWASLSLFPALIVLLTVYGLVSEADEVNRQVAQVLGSVSADARTLVTSQLRSLLVSGNLGWGLLFGLVAVLWTASNGMAGAIKAVALAYGERERRPFLKLRALALAFTLGALLVVGAMISLVALLPFAFEEAGSGPSAALFTLGRWGGLVLLMSALVAALYRFAPRSRHGGWEWAIKASITVSVLWAVVTAVFSVYVRTLSDIAATYGALAGLIVLMLWFYLTGYLILGGAAVAAEMWRVGEVET